MENVFVSLYLLDVKLCDMCGQKYVLQVVLEDCIGCNLCVEVCLVKDCQNLEIKVINMMFCLEYVEEEKINYDFFFNLLEIDCSKLECIDICILQLIILLFEYLGVCFGCGEMLYIKLLIQFYGDWMLIVNVIGCFLIYGGNLFFILYIIDVNGCGLVWVNFLFEDNVEFGFGFRLMVD